MNFSRHFELILYLLNPYLEEHIEYEILFLYDTLHELKLTKHCIDWTHKTLCGLKCTRLCAYWTQNFVWVILTGLYIFIYTELTRFCVGHTHKTLYIYIYWTHKTLCGSYSQDFVYNELTRLCVGHTHKVLYILNSQDFVDWTHDTLYGLKLTRLCVYWTHKTLCGLKHTRLCAYRTQTLCGLKLTRVYIYWTQTLYGSNSQDCILNSQYFVWVIITRLCVHWTQTLYGSNSQDFIDWIHRPSIIAKIKEFYLQPKGMICRCGWTHQSEIASVLYLPGLPHHT